jgi:hypothetical protein
MLPTLGTEYEAYVNRKGGRGNLKLEFGGLLLWS